MGIMLIDRVQEQVIIGKSFGGQAFKLLDGPAPHREQYRFYLGF
jgi:hypothetical protein